MTGRDPSAKREAKGPRDGSSTRNSDRLGEVRRSLEYLKHLEHFEAALKAVRLIVYAGMTSFIVLAIYGFLLIYRLTSDVHVLVGQTEIMTQQMQAMTRNMANMHQATAAVSADMSTITKDMNVMTGRIVGMDANVGRMADSVTLMQHSATNLDRRMSPMLGTMNRFVPFGLSGAPLSPPYAR